jgi:hypothetical protein
MESAGVIVRAHGGLPLLQAGAQALMLSHRRALGDVADDAVTLEGRGFIGCAVLYRRQLYQRTFWEFLRGQAFLFAIPARMESLVEYLFAADIRVADEAARRQGWHPNGRTGWLKADGNEVHFICFEEQLSVVGRDVTIYFVGELSQQLKRFKQKWTKLRR